MSALFSAIFAGCLFVTSFGTIPDPAEPQHPFFISVCEMELNAEDKLMEVSIRMFTDDLNTVLAPHTADKKGHLNTPEESEKDRSLLHAYVAEHLAVKGAAGMLNFTVLGCEYVEDLCYCYLEAPVDPTSSLFMVTNKVLFEIDPGQNNLVHLKVRGTTKSLRLHQYQPDGVLQFP
ncbi:MAG: DUF6702 family protein [Bacteroidota bacterium]